MTLLTVVDVVDVVTVSLRSVAKSSFATLAHGTHVVVSLREQFA